MYTDDDIEAAVTAGVLPAATAGAFREFIADLRHAPASDEEHFRLISGFADVFVTIALVLFLGALGWLLQNSIASPLAIAICSWGLAEYFTRVRRMALPSIVLLAGFVGSVFALAISVAAPDVKLPSTADFALPLAASAACAALAAFSHWRRFQVPITVAAGAAALATLAISLLLSLLDDNAKSAIPYLTLAAGIGIFALAMRWDISDPLRRTRRADVAFWLHLLASPLMVHSVFLSLGLLEFKAQMGKVFAVFAIYIALALVALIIDRRALMVSALAYVLYAMSSMFREFGAVSSSVALTGVMVGGALLLLSALWHPLRTRLVQNLPSRWQARLPTVR